MVRFVDEKHIPTAAEAVGRSVASAWALLAAVFAGLGLALGVMVLVMSSSIGGPHSSFDDLIREIALLVCGFSALLLVVFVVIYRKSRS
jgi:hypothetical protein